jgi:arylsulfatase A-like enzyme
MVPTVLDALGLEPPASIRGVTQSTIEGVSLVPTFDDAKAPDKHTTQYFEMMGHRSLYHDGWRAVCPWPGTSFTESGRKFGTPITYDMLTELDAKGLGTRQPEGGLRRDEQPRREGEGPPDRDDRHVVQRGRQI